MSDNLKANSLAASSAMGTYESHDLCPDLALGQMCFRAKLYKNGTFEPVFHEHIPSYRIDQASADEALRSLVARFSEWPGAYIVHSLLNERGHKPARYPGFNQHRSYPEPGVIRLYVSAPMVHAWHDSIVSEETFRKRDNL